MPEPIFNHPVLSLTLHFIIILVSCVAAEWLLFLITRSLIRGLEKDVKNPYRLARLKTIVLMVRSILFVTLLVIFLLVLLYSMGINITPVLTGAGIAGLALSLGAQSLIKDFLNGILILVEGQYAVGDSIQVNDSSGVVERITLRTTYLRALDGRVFAIPNGEIRTLSNLTSSWSRAVINLNLPFEADLSQAVAVLEQATASMQEDPETKADVLERAVVLGWNNFTDWSVQVQLMVKTHPGRQWDVARVLRQRALHALSQAGIPVEIPRQTVNLHEGSAPQGEPRSNPAGGSA
ncbi:MAG: mechanosensitive ion channel family protein [Anaerolineaceae bacterium]|nr:mechanosensitive ion channel family protein [Anaerolineaceae bacterium]